MAYSPTFNGRKPQVTYYKDLPAMSQPKKSRMEVDTAESSSTKTSIETRKLLRINHLLMDDRKAFDRYPRMKAKCEELIT